MSDAFFAQASDWFAKHGVGGIDWAALATKRQDSVLNPAYIDQYMLPAFDRAAVVIDSLDLPRRPPDEVLNAYAVLTSDVTPLADKALRIAEINVKLSHAMLFGSTEFTLELQKQIYGLFLYHLWISAMIGAKSHITGRIHRSGIPEPEIAYHASLVTMSFNVISALNQWGLLAQFKRGSANGLSAAPAAGLIVAGVVVAIAIVWGLVAIYQMSLRQKIVEKVCEKALDSGDPIDMQRCDELVNNPEANLASQVPKAFGNVLEKVAMVAMVGAGVYMLVLFGPGIATKVKQTIGAWRAG